MIDWPDQLVESIARRRCVLFLGAGVSANSENHKGKRPLTWGEFLNSIVTKKAKDLDPYCAEIQKMINDREYLLACELIVERLGDVAFGQITADEFRRPGYIPAEIHEVIYSLDSRIVISPNIDKIYEQYALNESMSTVVIKSYSDSDLAKYLRTNDYLIIRAHGNVDEVAKMIFTNRQYNQARIEYASFYRLIDALILTHTFVFIGCGISDPDIQLTLENANFTYEECLPHYFVAADNSFQPGRETVICKNRNLSILHYDNFSGNHTGLLDELKRLKALVDAKRDMISSNYAW